MLLASWWCGCTVRRPSSGGEALGQCGRHMHMAPWTACVGSARQRLDISGWLPGRGRTKSRRHERLRPWPFPLPALPPMQRQGHSFVESFPGRVCARCQHPERLTRGRCLGASGVRARGAALQFRLVGSAGGCTFPNDIPSVFSSLVFGHVRNHTLRFQNHFSIYVGISLIHEGFPWILVSHISCWATRWCLCSAFRVVPMRARGTAISAWRMSCCTDAWQTIGSPNVILGFLRGSKRTARLDYSASVTIFPFTAVELGVLHRGWSSL